MRKFLLALAIVAGILLAKTLFYYRGFYAPPEQGVHSLDITIAMQPAKGLADSYNRTAAKVVLDLAHSNRLSSAELTPLLSRLAARGARLELLKSRERLGPALENASGIIIGLPGEAWSDSELEELANFSGKIVLIADPERPSEVNSVGLAFGLIAAPGYVYDMLDNDGNFRWPVLREFSKDDLTVGLKALTVYGACAAQPEEAALASTARTGQNTGSERGANWPVIAKKERVALICDLNFMTQPYAEYADNSRFIANLADWLVH